MKRVKVSRSYQITIPAEIRKKLGIEIGDILLVKVVDNKILIEKAEDELPSFDIGREIREEEIEEALFKGLRKFLYGSWRVGNC